MLPSTPSTFPLLDFGSGVVVFSILSYGSTVHALAIFSPGYRFANNPDAQLVVSSVREAIYRQLVVAPPIECRENLATNAFFCHPSRHLFEYIALLSLLIVAAGLGILCKPSFFFTLCVPRLRFASLYRLFRTLLWPSVPSQGTPTLTLGTAFMHHKLPGTMQSGVAAKGSDAAVMSVCVLLRHQFVNFADGTLRDGVVVEGGCFDQQLHIYF